MRVSSWAQTHEPYCSYGMPSVQRRQEIRRAIERHLRAQGRGHAREEVKIVVVAKRVRLHAGQETLLKSRRLRLLAQEQFIGPVNVFQAAPDALIACKPQG